MHMPDTDPTGWTPERRAKFLMLLAENGNVRASAGRCGLSAQSAYKLRRRDALFARSWAASLLLARDHSEAVMAERALEGVEEPVFYRGEKIGVRRRYDTRLLLAHMARLDRQAERAELSGAAQDAARFDELLALVAGEELPEELTPEAGGLPLPRGAYIAALASELQEEMFGDIPAPIDEDQEAGHIDRIGEAVDHACRAADAAWDDWTRRACARVDGLGAVKPPLHLLPESCKVLARPPLKAWTLSPCKPAPAFLPVPAQHKRGGAVRP